MRAVVKKVDRRGRVVLPASWRREHVRGGTVLLLPRGDRMEILPQEAIDLTAYFDAAEVDVEADLADWHAVRRGLH
jgi:bifunctional DNA-binding transcriptional regulator/antitoxin component of YhaV-PrlF toxin-antitoxin module